MLALERVIESGELGQILHIEGHFSNEHSTGAAGTWRDSPAESPGGGLTGAGLHLVDAFVNLMGPVRRIHGYHAARKAPPDPRDRVTLLLEFADGTSGTIATVRPTPFFWRVHVFGDKANTEAIGETELVIRRSSNAQPERQTFEANDTLLGELENFADAIENRAAFHIRPREMLANVAAFEAAVKALETNGVAAVQ